MAHLVYPQVYDLAYPSPIPLRELSSIAVAAQLWRLELHRVKNTVNYNFCFDNEPEPNIAIRNISRPVPSSINETIDKYFKELWSSIPRWLKYHFDEVFEVHGVRKKRTDILNDFDDIVCDYDGSIDYVRTASRMILCDGISPAEKFKIACLYSFEDSIKRIWPSVEKNFNLNEMNFHHYHFLYYWVCRLRNAMDMIPTDDVMLEQCVIRTVRIRTSFEYFWDRASLQKRYEVADRLTWDDDVSFFGRFVLTKLNEEQLVRLVHETGVDLISNDVTNPLRSRNYVYQIWMYIKDMIDEKNFTIFVEKILDIETDYYVVDDPSVEKSTEETNDEKYRNIDNLTACCKIWASAPAEFKRSAIKTLLPMEWKFEKFRAMYTKPRAIQFIGTILWDATAEERRTFWLQNWLKFLTSSRTSDFLKLMEVCLGNEDEITLFKRDTLSKYENLDKTVEMYLWHGFFQELTNLFNICWPDPQTCRGIKRLSLETNFLDKDFVFSHSIIVKVELFREFIDDAYADDPKLAGDFRNQLLSKPHTFDVLSNILIERDYCKIMKFVDSMVSADHINLEQLKKRFLKPFLFETGSRHSSVEHFQDFLAWCLNE